MTRIEDIEKSVQWARDVFARDESHYARADAEDMIIPLPMNHRDLRNILSHIDTQVAELSRVRSALRSTEDQLVQVARRLSAKCGDGLPSGSGDTLANACERKINHLTAQLTAKDQERKDLAMLVRRLCHALSKTGTHPKVQGQAYDYLIRKGLQGSILREEQADGSN